MLETFIGVILPVAVIVLLGFLLGRSFQLDAKTFTTLSIYVLTPSLVFRGIVLNPEVLSGAGLSVGFVGFLGLVVSLAVIFVVLKVIGVKGDRLSAVLLFSVIPNSGNFGLPVSESAWGKAGLGIATIVLLFHIIYTNTIGVYIAGSGGVKEGNPLKEGIKKVFSLPTVYTSAVAFAVVLLNLNIPAWVNKPIYILSMCAIGVNLIQLGFILSRVKFRVEDVRDLILGITFKLIFVPLITLLIAVAFSMEGMKLRAVVLQNAMPSAVYSTILSSHFSLDANLTASGVFISTILSFVSLTVWISVLKGI